MIHRVSKAIVATKGEFIAMPTAEEMQELAEEGLEECNIPGVCLCVDGTHIRLGRRPAYSELRDDLTPDSFTNRKWYCILLIFLEN